MALPLKKNPLTTLQNFPIVGMGASAGGLDAFKKLLEAIPEDSGMAYVIVQHLSADFPSNLPEILCNCTSIPVHEIINDIHLAPNHVYIIPENNTLIAQDGVLKLKQRTRNEKQNNSIDLFFESLAEVHKTFAIGVIFSGTGFDGTAGFKKIKEFGGATIVQDPDTAAFKGMPQSAIDADLADYISAPENIPSQLLKIQKSYQTNYAHTEEENIPENEEQILNQILNLIFLRTGNDFRHYKQATLRRRIAKRMVTVQKNELDDYYNFLRNDKGEQDYIFNDFLIPVTYFFRDEEAFENLATIAFSLLLNQMTNNSLRIWVAGCSTGEEAYSLAICLHEYLLKTNNKEVKVQIFASDLSRRCIAKARTAIYSQQDIQHISEERLHHYFTKIDGHYRINKVIRDMCVFAVHNFAKDPPFARIDLVSCRNVLIYFNSFLQNKVIGSFHYALKDKGILFLGKSESVTNSQSLFDNIESNEKIYVRKYAPGRYEPKSVKSIALSTEEKIKDFDIKAQPKTDSIKVASDILLSKYIPASVLINAELEIVHFYGDTDPFLLATTDKFNLNILKRTPKNVSTELQKALSKVKKQKISIRKDSIEVENQRYLVGFKILPLPNDEEHFLILFHKKIQSKIDGAKKLKLNPEQQQIKVLENELYLMRQNVNQITQDQQIAVEELQTSNEELMITGEELQASNEELKTSSEELQSNNEELMCVNDELTDRHEQLISVQNYSESIIKTIREPLLIIDKNFTIKTANPAFYQEFKTTEKQTEGHYFFEVGNCQWDIREFKEQILKMLDSKDNIKDFRITTVCKGSGKKTMMINAHRIINSNPEGMMLIVLDDITDLVTSNELLQVKNSELKKQNQQLDSFTYAASHDLQEPLRKIHMFSRRVFDNEKEISQSSKHDLERVQFLIVNMSQLINDLITYSRTNFVEKLYKKTDLNLLLKKTINDLKDTIVEKKVLVSVDTIPELKVIPYQIQQVFTNLINNSIKYAREGVISEIKIRKSHFMKEEIIELGGNPEINYIKIDVTDNGIGFDKEFENKIFDPFYRLHNKSEYSGNGLGLTLVKKIVENHRGLIKASSQINFGTNISIYIPI